MPKCTICGEEVSIEMLMSHEDGHKVRPVTGNRLSYLLCLPSGVTSGRHEAAEAFVEAYDELRKKHPEVEFDFFPFSYRTVDGDNPALDAIQAIAK